MHPLMIAARLTVRDAGGAKQVAPHLDKSHETLTKELDPNFPGGKLGLIDAATIVQATGDRRILQAFAEECRCAVFPLPELAADVDDDTMHHISQMVTDFSVTLRDVSAAVADGRVNDNELDDAVRDWLKLNAAWHRLYAHMIRLNERSGPTELRAVA